jgi:hypothetical protein
VIKNLKERGFLEYRDPERPMIGGKREYCYAMTDNLKKRLADAQLPAIAQSGKPVQAAESVIDSRLF